jgi:hypothetical protein
MAIAHLLEDFTASTLGEPTQLLADEALEDERLMSFEQGYSAGWEDALAAQATETARLSETLCSNLRDLSFTYHDALFQMGESLSPLFQTLVQSVLPKALAASFGNHIVEQLHTLAQGKIEQPLSVVVAPGLKHTVQALLQGEFSAPVEVTEDKSLGCEQAHLRVGTSEIELDGDALIANIQTAVEAHNFQYTKDHEHG